MLTHNILVCLEKRGFAPNFHFLSGHLTGLIKQGQMGRDITDEAACGYVKGRWRKGDVIFHVFLKRAFAVLHVQTYFDPRKQEVKSERLDLLVRNSQIGIVNTAI